MAAGLLWLSPLLVVDAVGQDADRRVWNGVRVAAQLAVDGHVQSAQRVLTVALGVDPTSSEALLLAAQWQADQRAATRSTRILLERAIDAASWVENSPLVAAHSLAQIYLRTRDPSRAVSLLRPLLENPLTQQQPGLRDPVESRAAATVTLARAFLAAGQPRVALAAAQGALLQAPADVGLNLAAAAAAAAVGGPAAGQAQLRLAILAAPQDRRLQLALAAISTQAEGVAAVPMGEVLALASLLPPAALPAPGELLPYPLQEARWLGTVLLAATAEAAASKASGDPLALVRALLGSGATALTDVVAGVQAVLSAAVDEAAAHADKVDESAVVAAPQIEPSSPLEDDLRGSEPPLAAAVALGELERWQADFSGARYVDADGDGHWEERLQFVAGVLTSWVLDADQDGGLEVSVELKNGVPSLVRSQSVAFEYGAYPLLAVARVEQGEFDGEWLLRPGALSLPIRVRTGAAATPDPGAPPVTVATPPFPSFVTVREASYLRRQWREGRLWAVTSRFDVGRSIRREDRDGDGRFERVAVFWQQHPTRAVTDWDGDGHSEVTEIFDAGQLNRIKYDGDGDGLSDAVIDVASGDGIAWDLNGDGRADVRERTLANGVRVREFSTRLDGIFDTATELR